MLSTILAKICYYAQEHSHDWADRTNRDDIRGGMEHVSHVIACFLAQHTVHGSLGVDSNVVFDILYGPYKSLEEWKEIFQKIVFEWNNEEN